MTAEAAPLDKHQSHAAPHGGLGQALLGLYSRLLEPRDRTRFALLFVAMIIGAIIELGALASIQLYAALLAKGTATLPPAFARMLAWLPEQPGLTAMTGAMLAILLFKLAYFAVTFWAMAWALAGLRVRLATRLFKAFHNAPYIWHLQRPSAGIQRSLREDITEVVAGMMQILQLLLSIVTALAIGVFLVLALPGSALAGLLVTVVLFGLITSWSHRVLVAAGRRQRTESRNIIEAIQQGFGALTEARILGRRGWFVREFRQAMVRGVRAGRQRVYVQQITPLLIETVLMMAMMLMIAAILQLSTSLEAALQIATALVLAVFRLRQVLNKATNAFNRISASWPSFGAMAAELEALETAAADEPDDDDGPAPAFESLRFDAVGFGFPGQHVPAVDRIDFTITRGECVAIAGSTGAGKSTVVALMLGLLEPVAGQVLVDGRPLPAGLRQWRRRIGYVPQAIYLTNDTLAANVALGIDTARIDRDRVWEVLETAGLAKHVKTLPHGIDTQVGEHGSWLSGGQRQRVGIARALYHRPEVLILDEATSALDLQTEKAILQALQRFSGELTIIAITHRVNSLKFADQFLFLSHGQLAGAGKYQDLVANSAEFRKVTQTRAARDA